MGPARLGGPVAIGAVGEPEVDGLHWARRPAVMLRALPSRHYGACCLSEREWAAAYNLPGKWGVRRGHGSGHPGSYMC